MTGSTALVARSVFAGIRFYGAVRVDYFACEGSLRVRPAIMN